MEARDFAKAARYMGGPLTEATHALLKKAFPLAQRAAAPRHSVKKVTFSDALDGVWANDLLLPGNAIKAHLQGLKEGYLIAATLGTAMDEAIRRESLQSVAMGMAISACASVIIEHVMDTVCLSLAGDAFLTPRFSPGYQDLPLAVQDGFLRAVSAGRIGLFVTGSLMLVPEKSVTAVVGMTNEPSNACVSACAKCANASCAFREE